MPRTRLARRRDPGIAALPTELLIEIFSHLDYTVLFTLRSVSWNWLHMLTSPAFLRTRLQQYASCDPRWAARTAGTDLSPYIGRQPIVFNQDRRASTAVQPRHHKMETVTAAMTDQGETGHGLEEYESSFLSIHAARKGSYVSTKRYGISFVVGNTASQSRNAASVYLDGVVAWVSPRMTTETDSKRNPTEIKLAFLDSGKLLTFAPPEEVSFVEMILLTEDIVATFINRSPVFPWDQPPGFETGETEVHVWAYRGSEVRKTILKLPSLKLLWHRHTAAWGFQISYLVPTLPAPGRPCVLDLTCIQLNAETGSTHSFPIQGPSFSHPFFITPSHPSVLDHQTCHCMADNGDVLVFWSDTVDGPMTVAEAAAHGAKGSPLCPDGPFRHIKTYVEVQRYNATGQLTTKRHIEIAGPVWHTHIPVSNWDVPEVEIEATRSHDRLNFTVRVGYGHSSDLSRALGVHTFFLGCRNLLSASGADIGPLEVIGKCVQTLHSGCNEGNYHARPLLQGHTVLLAQPERTRDHRTPPCHIYVQQLYRNVTADPPPQIPRIPRTFRRRAPESFAENPRRKRPPVFPIEHKLAYDCGRSRPEWRYLLGDETYIIALSEKCGAMRVFSLRDDVQLPNRLTTTSYQEVSWERSSDTGDVGSSTEHEKEEVAVTKTVSHNKRQKTR